MIAGAQPYTGIGAYSEMQADVFSMVSNPASLASVRQVSVGVYTERKYMLEELGLYRAVVGMPISSGCFGLSGFYSGFSHYNRTQISLAYGKDLGRVDAGAGFSYGGVRVAGYQNENTIDVAIGTVIHLTGKLHAGLYAAKTATMIYRFGLGYEPAAKFFTSIEIEKEENVPVNVNVSMQYQPVERVLIRAVVSTSTGGLFTGVGFLLQGLRIDAVAGYHPQLGVSPGLLLLYKLKRKE